MSLRDRSRCNERWGKAGAESGAGMDRGGERAALWAF